jgi:hypothetical protein
MSRTAVGFYLAGFAAYWIIALNLVWLPNYLIRALGMDPAHAAWVIALPSAMQIVLAPGVAYLSQRLSLSGLSSRVARGVVGTLCVIIAGLSMASGRVTWLFGTFGGRIRSGSTFRFGVADTSITSLSKITERSNADAPRWEASSLSGVQRLR